MYANGTLKPGMLGITKYLLVNYDRYLKANLLQGNDRDINRFKSTESLTNAITNTQDNLVQSIPALNKAKQNFPNLYNAQVANLLFADPSGKKGEYINFLAKNLDGGRISKYENIFFEDVPKIKEALEKFEFLKKRGLLDVDLNTLTIHYVFYYVEAFSQKKPIEKEVLDKMQNLIVGKYEDFDIYKIDKQNSFLLPLISERIGSSITSSVSLSICFFVGTFCKSSTKASTNSICVPTFLPGITLPSLLIMLYWYNSLFR
jgi:hypothetical protein